jgi:hypothetical protein
MHLQKIFHLQKKEANNIIFLISPFLIIKSPKNVYRFSEDSKDNFLYDICIQNNCLYLGLAHKLTPQHPLDFWD